MAAVEAAALVPILLVMATFVLQGAAAIWTVTATDVAVRQAARAESLGAPGGGRAAAEDALPGALSVKRIRYFGPDRGVNLEVEVPRVSFLPQFTVSRTIEMP